MMSTATVTSKGQITIPKEVREALHLRTGDKVSFFLDESGRICLIPATQDISSLKGVVSKPKKPVSIEDMKHTIKKRGSIL